MKPLMAVKGDSDELLGLVVLPGGPQNGVLMGGSVLPTVFRSREAAQTAITRTRKYAEENNFPWGPWKIVRMYAESGR